MKEVRRERTEKRRQEGRGNERRRGLVGKDVEEDIGKEMR